MPAGSPRKTGILRVPPSLKTSGFYRQISVCELRRCLAAYPGQPPVVEAENCRREDVSAGAVGVSGAGVRVGRGEGVTVGVGETYQREVGVKVRVGGTTAVGVSKASGG